MCVMPLSRPTCRVARLLSPHSHQYSLLADLCLLPRGASSLTILSQQQSNPVVTSSTPIYSNSDASVLLWCVSISIWSGIQTISQCSSHAQRFLIRASSYRTTEADITCECGTWLASQRLNISTAMACVEYAPNSGARYKVAGLFI